jgi:CRP-like cAMP-binding protein
MTAASTSAGSARSSGRYQVTRSVYSGDDVPIPARKPLATSQTPSDNSHSAIGAAESAPQPLGTLSLGDVFGEISLMRGGETSATVVATRQSTVLFLGREYVERMVAAFPALRRYLEELAGDREVDNQLSAGIEIDFEEDQRVLV